MSPAHAREPIGKHACERCRKAKTRCLTDTVEEHGKCRKCRADEQDCEWKDISRTRRRKRTDARVTELERQIAHLNTALSGSNRSSNSYTSKQDVLDLAPSLTSTYGSQRAAGHSIDHAFEGAGPHVMRHGASDWVSQQDTDHAQGLLGLNTSSNVQATSLDASLQNLTPDFKSQLFVEFVETLLPQVPVVSFPGQQSFLDLETSRPNLAAAVVTAACSVANPQTYRILHQSLSTHLSHHAVVEGRKSLDLLQAILVMSIWHHPPEHLSSLSIYQWTHIACTMAMELGYAGKSSRHASQEAVLHDVSGASEGQMEKYRTMFGIYVMCSRMAISFRRRNMISYSPSTPDLVETFRRQSKDDNDKRLLAWLQLQHIAEDIERTKRTLEMGDDARARCSAQFKDECSRLSHQLDEWEMTADRAILTESMRMDLHMCRSKLREIAIGLDERTQVLEVALVASTSEKPSTKASSDFGPVYIRTLILFIHDCHAILDVVLGADVKIIRSMSMLTLFRVPYAFKALAMLQKRLDNPEDSIGKVIDQDTLRFFHYARAISRCLETASDNGSFANPVMLLRFRERAGDFLRFITSDEPLSRATMRSIQHPDVVTHRNESASGAQLQSVISDAPLMSADGYDDVYHADPHFGLANDNFWFNEFMDTEMDNNGNIAMFSFF